MNREAIRVVGMTMAAGAALVFAAGATATADSAPRSMS